MKNLYGIRNKRSIYSLNKTINIFNHGMEKPNDEKVHRPIYLPR